MADTSKLREWADSDREQAAAILYLSAAGTDDAAASASRARAGELEACADGWLAIADEADAAG